MAVGVLARGFLIFGRVVKKNEGFIIRDFEALSVRRARSLRPRIRYGCLSERKRSRMRTFFFL